MVSVSATPPELPTEVSLAPGLTLFAGENGNLPVTLRWIQPLFSPEAFAVDGDVVYAADEVALHAFRLTDGIEAWQATNPVPEEGLFSDGGVRLGLADTDTIRLWAPFHFHLKVDRDTGEVRSFSYRARSRAPRIQRFPAPRPNYYRIQNGLRRIVARAPNGEVAWHLTIDRPEYDPKAAVAVPGGLVLVAPSGHLIVLDTPTFPDLPRTGQ